MNKIILGFLIVALVSTICLKNVNAFKCYNCDNCDTVNSTTATSTCSGQCQKTIISGTNTAGTTIARISRACVTTCTATGTSTSESIEILVSCCTTDLCNSSTNINFSKTISFTYVLITAIIAKLLIL